MKKPTSIALSDLAKFHAEQMRKEKGLRSISEYMETLIENDYKANHFDQKAWDEMQEILKIADVPWVEKNGKLLK